MHRKLLSKILVIGIIVLFIGAGAISSAVDINIDVNEKSRDKSEFEPLDGYTEKISFIFGRGRKTFEWEPFEVNLTNGDLLIISYTTSGLIIKKATKVDINFFIGLTMKTGGFGSHLIGGMAIGDIDWE